MGVSTKRLARGLVVAGTAIAAALTGASATAAGVHTGPAEPTYHCQRFAWENPNQGAIRAFGCRPHPPADLPDPIYVRVPGHTFLCSGGGHSVVDAGRYDIRAVGCWQPDPPSGAR
jgi:hypothetical protein